MQHHTALAEMSESECRDRLRSVPVGRLAYLEDGVPVIRPVNFSVVDDSVVIWTVPTANGAPAAGGMVAFEADEIAPSAHTGWTVLATGRAEAVTDIDDLIASADVARRPWVSAGGDRALRLRLTKLVGHQLHLTTAQAE
jgi:nitroimidazol reductase NimA-like FMN-containing flavoprotein (pyridoxamine 5'-phosphate oxidase superfamily)